MPPSAGAPASRPRSAEQMARLLLSNGFRYDSWEAKQTAKSIQSHGGACVTLQLTFRDASPEALQATEMDAVNLVLFDPARKMFYGSSYQLERHQLTRPIVVQTAPSQVLVVETLAQETRPDRSLEQHRVTRWGCCPVEELKNGGTSFTLHRGTAQLLQVDQSSWPAECLPTAPSDAALLCDVAVNADAALAKLMSELVPPGVFVSADFTRSTPKPGTSTFRLTVKNIELAATSKDSAVNLADPDADWSVAAIAHNGFRPLGKGSEVPLLLVSSSEKTSNGGGRGRHESGSSSSSSPSSSTSSPHPISAAPNTVLLRSDLPLEMDRLPVHSSTSLVMAVRRRAPGSRAFAVVGFCVLPLCMMPMEDRDIRVENLPALRGPFSCEDARLLMLDSTSPYGRVPIAVTLTVEYHDTGVAPSSSAAAAAAAAAAGVGAGVAAPLPVPEEITRDDVSSASASVLSDHPPPAAAGGKPTRVLSTADQIPSPAMPGVTPLEGAPTSQAPTMPAALAASRAAGDDVGIFKLLCTIMEELHKVRESQDVLLRQTSGLGSGPAALSPAMQERLNKGLADGEVDVIDLAPRPLAVSWCARRLMQEGVQPLLHPLHGTLLNDAAPMVGQLNSSLYGFRVEGITVDNAVYMPADVCLLFSFGPLSYQQVGPLRMVSVEETTTNRSFKVYDSQDRAGLVWCEPTEALQSSVMRKFKAAGNATLYVHVYDALTMFYVATAHLPLAAFRRPVSATCAMMPMDVALQRDLSMTEQVVPPKVFPVMRHAGQVHLTIFCVGVGEAEGGLAGQSNVMRLPGEGAAHNGGADGVRGGGRVITAKKLRHVDRLNGSATSSSSGGGAPNADGGSTALRESSAGNDVSDRITAATATTTPPPAVATGGENGNGGGSLHRQRTEYIKKQLLAQQQSTGSPLLPGVPDAHVQAAQEAAEMEYRLRQLEHERAAVKSKRIAEALLSRLTVEHDVHVVSWRPEVIRTPFANPFGTTMQFFVEVDPGDMDVCAVVDGANFYLGPRERTEVLLVVRLSAHAAEHPNVTRVTARVYSERRELVCCVRVNATVEPPLVDRRYEVFGAAGTEVSTRFLSRTFSAASFPDTSNSAALLRRMRELCAFAATSSGTTTVRTNAVLDPITQTHITAWEEATVTTQIPKELGRQRIEYVTFFYDAAMSRVYETWELCVFACESYMTRDIYWGQTTALGLPAEGTEDLYCSDTKVKVERRGPSYVLRLHPRDVGTQKMLLHTLQDSALKKTLLTVPTVYPTPSYTQVIELSLENARGPVLRRLTFAHRGEQEEVFQVHHNYKFNLRVSPSKFALAPGDSQFVGLQFDMLTLPPGQLEGRWPMWIFINNSEDKTVESYHLEVVLRAHPVAPVVQE
ncbi:hypothetical protein ABB37_05482 [Leptomonas pyrrhocoris]|uniref:NPHP4 Ig-like domain-containing protein n=1 Tax=Leptomonas pyrrhocoris TaxID=157538 RepID=A0A0M9G0J3_LEPPY|nr:hypothetical protein ABB37_05482 [Leptomonas pyrrhocoris]KPA79719.1 hypothetical protein ABB37_05482 [Leptomonas pyrrhocoris]|eukprot:XP_015658158.1 hypothetical protein ABB37_05482 [Leptomonas pyrrhocoris]